MLIEFFPENWVMGDTEFKEDLLDEVQIGAVATAIGLLAQAKAILRTSKFRRGGKFEAALVKNLREILELVEQQGVE